MGYIRHHAIIVTSWNPSMARNAHEVASRFLPGLVSDIMSSRVNEYLTFTVGPDGSKEGWTESTIGDEQRAAFVEWLRSHRRDGYEWALVQYGDEDNHQYVIDASGLGQLTP